MRGMILAAGRGTRLRPLTNRRTKALLPLAGQPLISYPLNSLTNTGIDDVVIIAGDNESELQEGLAGVTSSSLSFARQPEPRGLADAVRCGQSAIGGDEFVLLFCDNVFASPLTGALREWRELRAKHPELAAMIHVIELSDPRAFGVAVVEDGFVVDMEEKPERPRSNLAVVGIDILTPAIFEAIERIKPSARGELEITDAIFELTRMGHKVHARKLTGFWYDTGTFNDLINALPPVMDNLTEYQQAGAVLNCAVSGQLGCGVGSHIEDCRITGPVLVGAGCQVKGCELGPYVVIGDGAAVQDCTLSQVQAYPEAALTGLKLAGAILAGERVIQAATPPTE